MANIEQCVVALHQGKVIAYPTEAVFGVGCDPDNANAIEKLLLVKQRAKTKGLILVAASVEQLIDYVDFSILNDEIKSQVLSTWPGAVTWIMPTGKKSSKWLSGEFDSIAVRVSSHPQIQALCLAFGKPITSTSANLSGLEPCRTVEQVKLQLGSKIDCVLEGVVGGNENPSEIRDAITGEILRQG